jgi:outer membrane protein assembly factor BamA
MFGMQFLSCLFVFMTICVVACHAQNSPTPSHYPPQRSCHPTASIEPTTSEGVGVSVAALSFSGFLQMPVSDQEQIAVSIKSRTYTGSLDGVRGDVEERLRREWQNRGYLKVEVTAEAQVLSADSVGMQISVTAQIDEGGQYRLRYIRFRNNRSITNTEILRNLFPINDGEAFNREAITQGLENLRKVYGEFGYANATIVPKMEISEEDRQVSVDLNIDEGKQFYVGKIKVLGARKGTLNDMPLKPGDIYNTRLVQLFLNRQMPGVDVYDPNVQHLDFDEKRRVVAITLDLSGCRP